MLPAGAATALQASRLALPTSYRTFQHIKFIQTSSQAIRPSTTAAATSPNQLLHDVCQQHGIHLDPTVQLAHTAWGLGLCLQQPQHEQKPQQQSAAVVAVPLELVLSCSIPGCSPTPQQMSAALHHLLHESAVNQSWEMQVAVLLLWALRQPPQSRVGSFWQQYRPLLPRGVQDCSSLLVWSDSQLRELQVGVAVLVCQWCSTSIQQCSTNIQLTACLCQIQTAVGTCGKLRA